MTDSTLENNTNRWVNDQHFQLNKTEVTAIDPLHSLADIRASLKQARQTGKPIAIAGGRHAAGGQQFLAHHSLLDTTPLNRILNFDAERGLIEVEAGIQWPQLIQYLLQKQAGQNRQWGIIQKPTGTDQISIGGSLSSNIHGRGLIFKPFIQDVEAFTLVDAQGQLHRCSRHENRALFSLTIGGYGLFGIIYSVTLRLQPRQPVRRMVQVLRVAQLMAAFQQAISQGAVYGDFQFEIDPASAGFLQAGIFACYHPTDREPPPTSSQKVLSLEDWAQLVYLAHTDKRQAFTKYRNHYLQTCGQLYWNDTHQLGPYKDGYHQALDARLGCGPSSEGITELYVPAERLPDFMADVAEDFRQHKVDLIYGTIRLIQKDDESFLPWAREHYTCVIFNLHTPHTEDGIHQSRQAFQRLIDHAIARGGSYYLTYHRFARRDQVLSCYPQFLEFLQQKQQYDPDRCFQSNWYRHYEAMFQGTDS